MRWYAMQFTCVRGLKLSIGCVDPQHGRRPLVLNPVEQVSTLARNHVSDCSNFAQGKRLVEQIVAPIRFFTRDFPLLHAAVPFDPLRKGSDFLVHVRTKQQGVSQFHDCCLFVA